MTIVDRIKQLCASKSTNMANLERELGLSKGSISKWSKSSPNSDSLPKIADYFHVSVDYLLGREEKLNALTQEDEMDLAKTMAKIRKQLVTEQGLMFDGEILDKETIELLLNSIEQQERLIKVINKKNNPNN
nr:helix-turn-helix transcriptional regulator [uncultured Cellulosilyticum sp.]